MPNPIANGNSFQRDSRPRGLDPSHAGYSFPPKRVNVENRYSGAAWPPEPEIPIRKSGFMNFRPFPFSHRALLRAVLPLAVAAAMGCGFDAGGLGNGIAFESKAPAANPSTGNDTGRESGKRLWADSFLGEPAPDLVVEEWLTERPDTGGKFVLIEFWATWCGPCRETIPKLNHFQKVFADDLIVIGVGNESAEDIRNFKEPEIRYSLAIDTRGRTKAEAGVTGIPHAMLIDPDGMVVWEGYPLLEGHELTEETIRGVIAAGRR